MCSVADPAMGGLGAHPPLTKTWSWRRNTDCLTHEDKFSFKFLTFSHFFLWKLTKTFQLQECFAPWPLPLGAVPLDPAGALPPDPPLGSCSTRLPWSAPHSARLPWSTPLWQNLDLPLYVLLITFTRGHCDSSCSWCMFICYHVGAECLENGWRWRLGYNGALTLIIVNGVWGIEWSRDRWRHVTCCGRAALHTPGRGCSLWLPFLLFNEKQNVIWVSYQCGDGPLRHFPFCRFPLPNPNLTPYPYPIPNPTPNPIPKP